MSTGLDLRLIPLVLSLGLDTFALSTTLGIAPLSRRTQLQLALPFAVVEGLIPIVGPLIGRPLEEAVVRWDVYAAAALLLVSALWMLREGLAEDDERAQILRLASAQGLSGKVTVAARPAGVALRPRYGATAAGAAARRACRIVIVPSSTRSMLEGAGPRTGGRTHGGEGG
jgi:Putative manganese efflux pump